MPSISTTVNGGKLETSATPTQVLGDVSLADVQDPTTLARLLTELRRTLQRVQSVMTALPILSMTVVRDVTFGGADVDVDHRLGRKWTGFAIVNQRSSPIVCYATRVGDAEDARFVRLTPTGGNGTADVWVW